MPRFDGTGPMGLGRMTGRGAGYCSGVYPRQRSFFGGRCGIFGGRRGNRFMYKLTGLPRWARSEYYENSNDVVYDEEKFLKAREKMLENELKRVREEIQKFKKDEKGTNKEE